MPPATYEYAASHPRPFVNWVQIFSTNNLGLLGNTVQVQWPYLFHKVEEKAWTVDIKITLDLPPTSDLNVTTKRHISCR